MDDKKKLINVDNDSPLSSDEDEDLKKPKPVTTSLHEGESEAPSTSSQRQPVFENGTFDNSEDVPPLLINVDEPHSTARTNVSYRIQHIVFVIVSLWGRGSDSY